MIRLSICGALSLALVAGSASAMEFDASDAFADFEPVAISPTNAKFTAGYRFGASEFDEQQRPMMTSCFADSEYCSLSNHFYLGYALDKTVGTHGYITVNGEAKLHINKHRHANEHALFSPELQLSALHYQHSIGKFKVRAGLQSLAWGEVDGSPVLDIASPQDASSYSADLAASRVAQWMLSSTGYLSSNLELQGFVTLRPQYSRMPLLPSAASIDGIEAGSRLTARLSGSDVSLYAGQFYDNQPAPAQNTKAEAKPEAKAVAGISANRSLGKWLLASDLAYKAPLHNNPKRIGEAQLALSFEYGNQLLGSFSAMAHATVNKPKPDTQRPVIYSFARWSKAFINETLTASTVASLQDSDLKSVTGSLAHSWRDNASWQLGLGAQLEDKPKPFAFLTFEQSF